MDSRKINGQDAVDLIVKSIEDFGFSNIEPFMIKQHLSSYAQMRMPITQSEQLFSETVAKNLNLLMEEKGEGAKYGECFEVMQYLFMEPKMGRISRFIKRHNHIITLLTSVTIPVITAILSRGS